MWNSRLQTRVEGRFEQREFIPLKPNELKAKEMNSPTLHNCKGDISAIYPWKDKDPYWDNVTKIQRLKNDQLRVLFAPQNITSKHGSSSAQSVISFTPKEEQTLSCQIDKTLVHLLQRKTEWRQKGDRGVHQWRLNEESQS